MIALALLMLAVWPARVPVVDQSYLIPANDWRYVDVPVDQPALLCVDVRVANPHGYIGLELVDAAQMERLRKDQPHGAMASTVAAPSAGLRYQVKQIDQYKVLVDNRDGGAPARVHLKVWLELPPVTTLSRGRQICVIVLSFAVFFGIVTWSARRLLRSLNRPPEPPSPLDRPGC